MSSTDSRLATLRQQGATQVDLQRANILAAAERLFLINGLEQTTMADIAEQAEITRVTLYRYFANRDEVALALYPRMIETLASLLDSSEHPPSLAHAATLARAMIRNFEALRNAYRFFGVFDAQFLDHSPQAAVRQQISEELGHLPWLQPTWTTDPAQQRAIVLLSAVIWFLEKLALRSTDDESVQGLPLATHLEILEEIVTAYIERLLTQST
jgi:AcrR family transcriptional regulator